MRSIERSLRRKLNRIRLEDFAYDAKPQPRTESQPDSKLDSSSGVLFVQRQLAQLEFSIDSRIQAIRDAPLPELVRGHAQDLERASLGRAGETVRSFAANPIPGLKVRLVPLPRKSKRN